MRKLKLTKKGFAFSAVLFILISLSSCSLWNDIEVHGKVHYYHNSTVNSITVTVTGGTSPYTLYYAKTATKDSSYASSQRSRVTTDVPEGEEYTFSINGGYASTGWWYYVWAKDAGGKWSYPAVWHIN